MYRVKHPWRKALYCAVAVASLFTLTLSFSFFVNPASIASAESTTNSCQLDSTNGALKHVIYVQFDNTHFTRDNPNVPSDLEQMPHLLNFLKDNGTLLTNHHTPLIAHTATDILTSITGVYGDSHGMPVSNSYRYFTPTGTSDPASSFAYWTAPVFDLASSTPTDTSYTMIAKNGKNAPAPWVPYTRAGCNFGAVATANTILENTAIDIPTVFGANSPEAAEVKANPNQAAADFVGIGIHCAKASATCVNGRSDVLPDEPGGYNGYNGLFGNKYVAPQISPNGPVTNLDGNVIQSSTGNVGFPGFDGMSASNSLGYVAAMQEHGVPVTYAYISDAHDNHAAGGTFGPGEAGYVAQLKSYDNAFAKFFDRLNKDGINRSNTLFVFTADEGDHFVGSQPTPANCDGVTVPCTYNPIGEVNGNLSGLLATERNNTTPFTVHSDSAPNYYITGNPAQNSVITRKLERDVSQLTTLNPYTGKTDTLTNFMADQTEMKLLHMVTADPQRTPTFTQFANPDYFLFAGAPNCSKPCITIGSGFAWNHGDVSPDVNTTWLGMVGPGVKHVGVDNKVWSDHTDIRPTILALSGLKDDYLSDGRVLFEITDGGLVPHSDALLDLAQVYKQINASVGDLGLTSLKISTKALASNDPGDATYVTLEGKLSKLTSQRDALAAKISKLLNGVEFNHETLDAQQARAYIAESQALLAEVHALDK